MGWLSIILLILFIPICLLLILIVLLQAGKGGGLAGAFGGSGGGQTFLGTRGAADFLGKLTIYLAIGFMVLSFILSLTYGRGKTISIGPAETETPVGEAAATQQGDAAEAGQSEAPSVDQGGETPPSEEAE